MGMDNIIEFRNVTKVFPAIVANDNVSFGVRRGEIHAIVGENGAGKSTLMNMMYGLLQPTSGEILLNGKPVRIETSSKALSLGLGMVHQHFMLAENFTVLQNVILGAEVKDGFKVNYEEARKQVLELSDMYALRIDPDKKVKDISVPMQQRVEILKVLWRKADIIIFDEPTAVLTPQEINEFCEIALKLKEQGKTLLFISHKLGEVMRISDRVTVMQRGKVVCTKNIEDTDEKDMAQLMVGRSVKLGGGERKPADTQKELLTVRNVNVTTNGVKKLDGIDLTVYPGEILGVIGIDGNGQDELVNAICGKMKIDEGEILLNDKNIVGCSVKQVKDAGLATVYEDRHKDGLVLDYSIVDNLILGYQDRPKYLKKQKAFLNFKEMWKNAEELKEAFDIRCGSLEVFARTLSGGNQQKVILAREISAQPKLLMIVQPTRGLDMGAIEFVHDKVVEQRNAGCGVLLFTLELDEVLSLSDRIAVIHNGKIIKILDNKNVTKQQIGKYMLGVLDDETRGENK